MVELTRRTLLRSTGAAGAVVAYGALGSPASPSMARLAPPPGAWNHNPSSRIGPLRWADIGFPTCGQGTSQSPVNISTRNVDVYRGAPLKLRYHSSEVIVENTGHVVEVPIPEGVHDRLEIGDDSYELTQYHFHAPSEHTVNGRSADVEAHFVHVNAQGAIAVVGVFFNQGQPRNEVLERILLSAPGEEGEEAHAGHGSPADLFDRIDGIKATRNGGL